MYRTAVATLVTALIPCFAAPENTDFSGIWEMDAARSVSAHSSSSVPKVTLVIKQTATELSIETRQGVKSETII
jgi:hypothetical protein